MGILAKVVRSLRKRGIGDTWREIRSRLERPIRSYWDAWFDRQHGTDTSGIVELSKLTSTRGDTSECIWYQPVPLRVLRQIFAFVDVDFTHYSFVDYGSGKGRALLVASEQPFKQVIGVEFAQELHQIATKNIDIYSRTGHAIAPIRSVHMDAVEFEIPDGPVLLFLFTPFKGDVMNRVLERIKNHARTNEVMIVYYGQLPENVQLLDDLGWHRKERPMSRNLLDLQKYRLLVYSNQAHQSV